jgi:hypothetical protein
MPRRIVPHLPLTGDRQVRETLILAEFLWLATLAGPVPSICGKR